MELLLLHVEMAEASLPNFSWTPPWGDFLGMSHQEAALGKSQDALEGRTMSLGWPKSVFRAPLTELVDVSVEREV